MSFIKGDAIILYIWDNVSAYKPVACLTSNSLAQTRNIIESQTKCNPGLVIKDAGSLTYEITFEGNYIDTTSAGSDDTDKISHDGLKILLETGAKETWRLSTGLTDNQYYYGEGIFSDLSNDASAGDELATFSGTLSGSGAITTTDPN